VWTWSGATEGARVTSGSRNASGHAETGGSGEPDAEPRAEHRPEVSRGDLRHAERTSARGNERIQRAGRGTASRTSAGGQPGDVRHAEHASARGSRRFQRAGDESASRRSAEVTSGTRNASRHAETDGSSEPETNPRAGDRPEVSGGDLRHAEHTSARRNRWIQRAGHGTASRRSAGGGSAGLTSGTRNMPRHAETAGISEPEVVPRAGSASRRCRRCTAARRQASRRP
jgi:hypothetical protein